jgi:hypothetical protein
MLCVRIEGQEVETTPALLATLVFEGQADRDSPVKLLGAPNATDGVWESLDGLAEGTLEQSLGAPYGEALTGELHRRLQRLGTMDSSGIDVAELRTRVESLCQWRWANLPLAARFFWTAGWLNELGDRVKTALAYYDAFLLMPAQESHLRLLALNNRGVLRIRLGRRDGVVDLARAAIGCQLAVPSSQLSDHSPPATVNCQLPTANSGLSVACFNLLNLIHTSFGTADRAPQRDESRLGSQLLRAVDEELMDFFSQLRSEQRALWLGPEEVGQKPEGKGQKTEDGAVLLPGLPNAESRGGGPPLSSVLRDPCQPILRDPTYRRLNMLVTRLAACVDRQDFAPLSKGAGHASLLFRQLSLWDCRESVDSSQFSVPSFASGVNGSMPTANRQLSTGNRQLGYAEAGSLLLSDDIPLVLTKPENRLVQVERAAEEELAALDGQLAAGQYELAQARLQVQRRILASLNGHGGSLAALRARLDAQGERVAHLEAQEEQFRLQRACAGFVSEVEQFCTLDDLSRAQKRLEDLGGRLHQFRARLPAPTSTEVTGLLDELAARCRTHLQELQRRQIESKIGAARQHVRENWPADASIPIPDSVRQALAQCRRHDPEGRIEDWAALEKRLDVHQGRYHTHRALSALQGHPETWHQVQDELVEALGCDPDQWSTLAPLFGLASDRPGRKSQIPSTKFQTSSNDQNPKSQTGPATGVGVSVMGTLDSGFVWDWGVGASDFRQALDRAGSIVAGVLPRLAPDAGKCVRLWECVAQTLAPALAGRDVEALARATALARTCRDHWPAGLAQVPGRRDPRHPVNRFLEACEKARRLVEAEGWLEAEPPQLGRAERQLVDLLQAGLETRDQLQRAVTGLYLARFREEDTPGRQRQVLAALEDWVTAMPPEEVTQIRGQEATEEMERIRQ